MSVMSIGSAILKHERDAQTSLNAQSNRAVIAILSDRWRVIDDPLQWILQVRRGHPSQKASGWRTQHYCRQRTTLLRLIHEICGEVDPAALAIIEALPHLHHDRDKSVQAIAAE